MFFFFKCHPMFFKNNWNGVLKKKIQMVDKCMHKLEVIDLNDIKYTKQSN